MLLAGVRAAVRAGNYIAHQCVALRRPPARGGGGSGASGGLGSLLLLLLLTRNSFPPAPLPSSAPHCPPAIQSFSDAVDDLPDPSQAIQQVSTPSPSRMQGCMHSSMRLMCMHACTHALPIVHGMACAAVGRAVAAAPCALPAAPVACPPAPKSLPAHWQRPATHTRMNRLNVWLCLACCWLVVLVCACAAAQRDLEQRAGEWSARPQGCGALAQSPSGHVRPPPPLGRNPLPCCCCCVRRLHCPMPSVKCAT